MAVPHELEYGQIIIEGKTAIFAVYLVVHPLYEG